MIEIKDIKSDSGNIKRFILKSEELTVSIINYGATVTDVIYDGRDVVLGCAAAEEYPHSGYYFGATIGRVCNRIGKGRFVLNGKEYRVTVNQGNNSLHGGKRGFDKRFFDYSVKGDKLELSYLSADGEEGYPANLSVKAVYYVKGADLHIEYEAIPDADTVCNMTNHSYFNLNGQGEGEVLDHSLYVNADYIVPINEEKLPTGTFLAVDGTPFDFRTPSVIAERINNAHPQIVNGKGLDHAFLLNGSGLRKAATVIGDKSGIKLDVITDQKALQVYCARFSNAVVGKNGKTYRGYAALCLEAEGLPDAANNPRFPGIAVKKGEKYAYKTIYRFGKDQTDKNRF